jgi:hypothetical protein
MLSKKKEFERCMFFLFGIVNYFKKKCIHVATKLFATPTKPSASSMTWFSNMNILHIHTVIISRYNLGIQPYLRFESTQAFVLFC